MAPSAAAEGLWIVRSLRGSAEFSWVQETVTLHRWGEKEYQREGGVNIKHGKVLAASVLFQGNLGG